MSLKQLIKQKQLIDSGAVDAELELPGEPLIYSIKYVLNNRRHTIQFFRNKQWKSIIKSLFRSYYKTNTPVVLLIRFFVSPPSYVKVKEIDLKRENVPAVFSYELCDYLLSFMEMIHHVLINSYRQIVKVVMEKYYSKNPRTTFKFMKWDHYVSIKNKNSVHPATKSVG